MDNNNRRKKQGSPIAVVVMLAALVATMLNNPGRDRRILIGAVIFIVLMVLLAYIFSVVLKGKLAEEKEVKNPFSHSHDRLNKSAAGDACDVDDHWRVQLEGFLKAGIIDRAEYQVLLRKHSKQAADSGR